MSKAAIGRNRLAVDGGEPVRSSPLPGWPGYAADEIEAVARVLRSGKVNYWTGEEGRALEQEYAAHVGVQYGVALANGTLALEAALYALRIGAGDEVVVPCRTFIASASCVVMRGARPVVADVDPDSQTLTAESVRAVLSPRTRAIIPVHLAGWPCDMDPLLELAAERGLFVIEDCAQAHGARYKGRPVGSMGHAAAFSFCQDKIITTGGEGGLLVTGDERLWRRVWSYKDHGKTPNCLYNNGVQAGFVWKHETFGTNWRMTEMQAVLARTQLRKLEGWVQARRRNAAVLAKMLGGMSALRVPMPAPDIYHSYYRFTAFVRPEGLREGWDRDRILAAIAAEGVPVSTGGSGEIYLEKAFSPELRPPQRLRWGRELAETSLVFLVHPTLNEDDMSDICQAVEKVMTAATKKRLV